MSITGERIRAKRIEKGLSQTELASRSGYQGRSTIAKLEAGTTSVPQTKAVAIADVLGVSVKWLLGWSDDERPDELPPYTDPIPQTKKVPLLGDIACGTPTVCSREYDFVDGPQKADFCLTAKGDSMKGARIYDGDIVFCQKVDLVPNGCIAAVIVDDSATLKRFYWYRDKSLVILKPENPDYPDQIYLGEEINKVRVIGKAIAFQGKLN